MVLMIVVVLSSIIICVMTNRLEITSWGSGMAFVFGSDFILMGMVAVQLPKLKRQTDVGAKYLHSLFLVSVNN